MPPNLIEWIDPLALALVTAGVALVVANWVKWVGQRVGWVGAWLAVTGGAMSLVDAWRLQSVILLAGAVAIGLMWLPRRRRGWTPRLARGSYRPWDHESELLRLCRGDKAMVERLIRYEVERNPQLSRAGAALSAATRLRHENA